MNDVKAIDKERVPYQLPMPKEALSEIVVPDALAPGWIATPMTSELRSNETRNQAILERTPLGRWGDPSELVGPALFLTSHRASFVTGTLLNVDGGYAAV